MVVKLLIFFLLFLEVVSAKTYPIVEPDLLQEIEKAVSKVNPENIIQDLRQKLHNYRPPFLVYLPPAEKSYQYEVDMTYELEFDIPKVNERGEIVGVLYPKGYKFNPLKYLKYPPPTLIVFNPKRKTELLFVKHIKDKYERKKLLIVKGDVRKVIEALNEPVYYLHKLIVEKLRLKNTISIITWDLKQGVARVEVYSDEDIKKIVGNNP